MEEGLHPEMPAANQQMLHDELDTVVSLIETFPPGFDGVVAVVLTDENGGIHTHFRATEGEDEALMNMAVGLMSIAQRILRGDPSADGEETEV